MARISAPAQADAIDALGSPLDGAAEGDALEDGDGDGLGLGLLLQAPSNRAPTTTSEAIDEIRGRPACAIVGLVMRLQRCVVPDDATPSRRMRSKTMGIEIERKFLVRDRSILAGSVGTPYRQGYLSRHPDRTVRVRRAGDKAFLTVKGRSTGPSRAEFEYEIPIEDADALLEICETPIIDKTRHLIADGDLTWEVDVFHGENDGLVVAELELDAADRRVSLPAWVGDEVTDDPRYFNASLVAHPYRNWDRGT